MDGTWLTYHELASELGTSAEGARRRGQRGRWTRQRANDGLARVLVPEGVLEAPRPVRTPSAPPDSAGASAGDLTSSQTIVALEGHVATLKAELEHRGAEIDTLKTQLASAEGRAADEAAKTAQAIAAFQSLADRLEALAEARRPWWRRLTG